MWSVDPDTNPSLTKIVCFLLCHLQHYAYKKKTFCLQGSQRCSPWWRKWSRSALRTVCGCSPPSRRSDLPGQPRTADVEVPAQTDTFIRRLQECVHQARTPTQWPRLSDLWGAFGGGVETRAAEEKIDLLPGLTTGFLKMKETLNLWTGSGLQQVLHRT